MDKLMSLKLYTGKEGHLEEPTLKEYDLLKKWKRMLESSFMLIDIHV